MLDIKVAPVASAARCEDKESAAQPRAPSLSVPPSLPCVASITTGSPIPSIHMSRMPSRRPPGAASSDASELSGWPARAWREEGGEARREHVCALFFASTTLHVAAACVATTCDNSSLQGYCTPTPAATFAAALDSPSSPATNFAGTAGTGLDADGYSTQPSTLFCLIFAIWASAGRSDPSTPHLSLLLLRRFFLPDAVPVAPSPPLPLPDPCPPTSSSAIRACPCQDASIQKLSFSPALSKQTHESNREEEEEKDRRSGKRQRAKSWQDTHTKPAHAQPHRAQHEHALHACP